MLTKDQVLHLAKLSRLSLSSEEVDRFSTQLSSILDYVGQLQKVAAPLVAAGFSLRSELVHVMRHDEAKKQDSQHTKKLVQAAPAHEGNLVKTKAVF